MSEAYPRGTVNLKKDRLALNQPDQATLKTLPELGLPALKSVAGDLLERSLKELVRYYRHSAVGRRCQGIIHNLNAPLQVLSFQMELFEQRSGEEQEYLRELSSPAAEKLTALFAQRRQRFKQMRQELENLHNMTRRLYQQGTHEDLEDRVYLDFNRLIQDELALYQDNLFYKHQVQKHFSFQASLPPVYGSYIDFSQSFRNLVDNALEAMETAEIRRLVVETRRSGTQRLLRIGDTGGGIPAELAERIFEPFFTTKGNTDFPRAGLGL